MLHRIPVSVSTAVSSLDTVDAERLARLHFHIRTGDYFPTLVTILGFIEETLSTYLPSSPPDMPQLERELIKSLRKDLMYLYDHYQLQPKYESAT
jgi:hypothetical protein